LQFNTIATAGHSLQLAIDDSQSFDFDLTGRDFSALSSIALRSTVSSTLTLTQAEFQALPSLGVNLSTPNYHFILSGPNSTGLPSGDYSSLDFSSFDTVMIAVGATVILPEDVNIVRSVASNSTDGASTAYVTYTQPITNQFPSMYPDFGNVWDNVALHAKLTSTTPGELTTNNAVSKLYGLEAGPGTDITIRDTMTHLQTLTIDNGATVDISPGSLNGSHPTVTEGSNAHLTLTLGELLGLTSLTQGAGATLTLEMGTTDTTLDATLPSHTGVDTIQTNGAPGAAYYSFHNFDGGTGSPSTFSDLLDLSSFTTNQLNVADHVTGAIQASAGTTGLSGTATNGAGIGNGSATAVFLMSGTVASGQLTSLASVGAVIGNIADNNAGGGGEALFLVSDSSGNTGVYFYTDHQGFTNSSPAFSNSSAVSELKLLAILDHPVASSEVILHH
jgi:hypothetical protein